MKKCILTSRSIHNMKYFVKKIAKLFYNVITFSKINVRKYWKLYKVYVMKCGEFYEISVRNNGSLVRKFMGLGILKFGCWRSGVFADLSLNFMDTFENVRKKIVCKYVCISYIIRYTYIRLSERKLGMFFDRELLIRANHAKAWGAKLKNLRPYGYGSQLPGSARIMCAYVYSCLPHSPKLWVF